MEMRTEHVDQLLLSLWAKARSVQQSIFQLLQKLPYEHLSPGLNLAPLMIRLPAAIADSDVRAVIPVENGTES